MKDFLKKMKDVVDRSNIQNDEWENLSTELINDFLKGTFGEIDVSIKNNLEKVLENRKRQKDEETRVFADIKEINLSIKNRLENMLENRNSEKDDEPTAINEIIDELIHGANGENPQKINNTNDFDPEATALLQEYASSIGLESITPHQLAIGISVSYLKDLGWNEEQFYGMPNGGSEGEILGADIAITRMYPPGTPGYRSKIASFAEKYVWCAVHEIMGYFSDVLKYREPFGDKSFKVEDYSSIIYIPNPAQELLEENRESSNKLIGWFLPNDLCPELEPYKSDKKRNITKWIDEADVPSFSSWVLPSNENIKMINKNIDDLWICIHNFTTLTERKTDVHSLLWISSYLTTEEGFNFLKKECSSRVSNIKSLLRMGGTYCTVRSQENYISPFDLLWIPWKTEDGNQIDFWTISEEKPFKYTISPAVVKALYDSEKYGESTYYLPSKKVRNMCNVTYGDNIKFFDKENNIIGFNTSCGEELKDVQYSLFVKRSCLETGLKNNCLKLFWFVKLIREPSPRAWYELDKFRYTRERVWLLWREDDETKSLLIKDVTDNFN